MMRSLLIAFIAAAWFAGSAPAQDKKLTLRWYGQSFFQLETTTGTKIVFDPHAIEQYPRVMVTADLVLISHPHLDHATLIPVTNRDKAKVLAGVKVEGRRQEWITVDEKFKDIQIRNVGLFHDKDSGMSRGRNSAFIVEVDGLKICHLGDLGHELNERHIKAIGEIDVLFIPIGGIYTINGTDAKKVVEQLKPKKLIVPMHYATKVFEDLIGPEEFLDGLMNIEKKPDTNEITIDPSEKPAMPKIILMGWKKGGD